MIGQVIKSVGESFVSSYDVAFYPNIAEQSGDAPFAVYNISDREPLSTKNSTATIDRFTFNITVFSKDFATLDEISSFIASGFDGYSGTVSVSFSFVHATKTVHLTKLIDQSDSFDPDGEVHAREMTFSMILQR